MSEREPLELGRRCANEVSEVEFNEEWLKTEDEILLMSGYNDDDVMVEFYINVNEWDINVEWIFDTPKGNGHLDSKGGFEKASNPDDLILLIQEVVSRWEDGEY